jgi:hypothetical protein
MRHASPGLWTAIGAVVGAFLMPSTWFLLVLLTVGATVADSLGGVATGTSLGIDPATGELQETPAAGGGGGVDLWATRWIWFAVLISLVVTVLSSVFFGWLGRRLAQLHNQPLEAREEQPAYN